MCNDCYTTSAPSQGIAVLASMVCDDGEKAVEFVKTTANANGHLTPLNSKDVLQQVRSRDGTGFRNQKLAAEMLCTLEMYSNKSEEAAAMISTKYNSSQAVVETAQKAVDDAHNDVVLAEVALADAKNALRIKEQEKMEAEKQSSVWKNLMPFCASSGAQSNEEGAAAAAAIFMETQLQTITNANFFFRFFFHANFFLLICYYCWC